MKAKHNRLVVGRTRTMVLLLLAVLTMMSACGNKKDELAFATPIPIEATSETPTPEPTLEPTSEPTVTPEPTPDLTGKAPNMLTGEYIDEEVAKQRPVAFVYNNMKKALPQSGLSQAGLYYEVLAEGDITRIIAVFQDYNSEKIGPIRSARHYFANFVLDNEAFLVHHGASSNTYGGKISMNLGYETIRQLKLNNIDAMKASEPFWRDPVRKSQPGMLEHSSYTNQEKVSAYIAKRQWETDKKETYESLFSFYETPTIPIVGTQGGHVTVVYNKGFQAKFDYDATTHLYMRSEFGQPQIDEETNAQLGVTNVIIQYAVIKSVPGDTIGRRDVDLAGTGKGLLLTEGVYTPINWSKKDYKSPTVWTDEEGNKLTLNVGKTWICVTDKEPIFEAETK